MYDYAIKILESSPILYCRASCFVISEDLNIACSHEKADQNWALFHNRFQGHNKGPSLLRRAYGGQVGRGLGANDTPHLVESSSKKQNLPSPTPPL